MMENATMLNSSQKEIVPLDYNLTYLNSLKKGADHKRMTKHNKLVDKLELN